MVSDATVNRYYYIFDSRSHRTLVLDRATGKEVQWAGVPRIQLVEHVGAEYGPSMLRRFAEWCARLTDIDDVSTDRPAGKLWRAVQTETATGKRLRRNATEHVVRAAALGLPRRRIEAAQLLLVHACLNPDPRHAAIDAAHMSERWGEFSSPTNPEKAVRAMRQRHVDWLLDTLHPT